MTTHSAYIFNSRELPLLPPFSSKHNMQQALHCSRVPTINQSINHLSSSALVVELLQGQTVSTYHRVGQKMDHFWTLITAMVSGKKVSDMSKVCKFCLEKSIKLAQQCV